jgi:Na+/proline symporter
MAVAAVIIMYAAFLVVGWLAAQKVKHGGAADLLLAGRAMPLWIATLSMTATWVDGGYLLGTAEGVYKSSVALGGQGGLCFGVSLILGGIFFAATMRRHEFTTLIDPFEARFGKRWAAVLSLPAMLGEVFWSAELLVAIGSTFGILLGMDLQTAILLSAIVVTAYTIAGGMWSVAYTDAFQLLLVVLGLAAALPFALGAVGGLDASWLAYVRARPDRASVLPPLHTDGSFWTMPAITGWWDVSLMLILGGIPWNCYFQRVLACQTPRRAQWHSIFAGVLTIALTVPPLLLGTAAFNYAWPAALHNELASTPALTLPLLLQHMTPPLVGMLGLGAIIGAVTSSYSASILSAGAMFTWNCCKRLVWPDLTMGQTKGLMRGSLALLSAAAVVMAIKVQSVQALWFFTSDLVFVLLFPQLLCALFDPRANRTGSIVAFVVALALRLGGGEPLFGVPALLPYAQLGAWLVPSDPASWYAPDGGLLFPFRTVAAAAGLVLLPVVSRLSAQRDLPQPLCAVDRVT